MTDIQKCNNGTFIFSGSKRHLMGEIFTSPSRPFYQSVLIMNLRPISVESVITAAVRSLLDKDLITVDKGVYMVYDPFFGLWINNH